MNYTSARKLKLEIQVDRINRFSFAKYGNENKARGCSATTQQQDEEEGREVRKSTIYFCMGDKSHRSSKNKNKVSNGRSLSYEAQGLYALPAALSSALLSPASITSLNLSSNLFSDLPDELSQLCNIEVLNVADNYIRYFFILFSVLLFTPQNSLFVPSFLLHNF